MKSNMYFGIRKYLLSIFILSGIAFSSCVQDDEYLVIIGGESTGDLVSIEGNYGSSLKSAWCNKLSKTHVTKSYSDVWEAFKTNGIREDGLIDDIYGGPTTNYQWSDKQSNTNNTNAYNREHSFPKSWWGGSTSVDIYTDLHHLYPCDATANTMRLNNAFGEVESGKETWTNGYCKLGSAKFVMGNTTVTVFEPNDDIKGDLARTYFYIATRYENQKFVSANGSNSMLEFSTYPFFKSDVLDMLIRWHKNDPVSEKEKKRNEANYAIQRNRNPFIDYPELVDHIWGDKKTVKFYYKDTAAGVEIK